MQEPPFRLQPICVGCHVNAMQFSAHKFTYALGSDCEPLDLVDKRKQSAPSSVAATFVANSDVDLR